ncbi:uncharacterized protein LOC105217869 isoform X2 [Zeugodacus cucurbitae]|uniref:uncharacterized protein LOC105217869 isoform X2 n=1 Tax=Zeugodacus cucurbitae TaxID=28588 RepID=UPI0023D962CB|nr:uncharacterized protein LOC105217869 isoform X2 [Zeugodacus cucurbitae]
MLPRSTYLYCTIGVLLLVSNMSRVSGKSIAESTNKPPDPMSESRNQATIGYKLTSNTNAGKMSADGNSVARSSNKHELNMW